MAGSPPCDALSVGSEPSMCSGVCGPHLARIIDPFSLGAMRQLDPGVRDRLALWAARYAGNDRRCRIGVDSDFRGRLGFDPQDLSRPGLAGPPEIDDAQVKTVIGRHA